MSLSDKPWFRKFLVSLVGKPLLKDFNKKSMCVKETQEKLLKSFIENSKDNYVGIRVFKRVFSNPRQKVIVKDILFYVPANNIKELPRNRFYTRRRRYTYISGFRVGYTFDQKYFCFHCDISSLNKEQLIKFLKYLIILVEGIVHLIHLLIPTQEIMKLVSILMRI